MTKVIGLELVVMTGIFSPKYFNDSAWFAQEAPSIVGNHNFLEIGTGTGIMALNCALHGAQVTATDINPRAAMNAWINFQRYGIDAPVLIGDMYEPVKGQKFDFIMWNHPFNNSDNPNEDMLHRAGFDYKYQSLDKYVSQAHRHLTQNGTLLLGTGIFADQDALQSIAANNGYNPELLRSTEIPMERGGKVMDRYMIYALRRIK